MQELVAAGRIVQTKPGRVPRYKRYLDEMPGVPLQDQWADIGPVQSQAKERVGYPTQKPLALLERIITASSNEGDVVLDPFCGCATTLIAAETLGRQWAGIDLSAKAVDLVKLRLSELPASLRAQRQDVAGLVTARTDIPRRTDIGKVPPYRQAETRPVWAAGRPMQRLRDGVSVPGIHRRPYRAAVAWWHGPPGELATAVWTL